MSSDATAAQSLKDQGNAKFKAGQYGEAVQLYTEAIGLDGSSAALHSNRSVSQLLLGKHQEALSDAQQACRLKPEWDKGHFRCGAALEAMGDLAKALPAYQRALELNPMSEEIIRKVRELKMKVPSQPRPSAEQRAGAGAHHSMPGFATMGPVQQVPPGGIAMPSPSSWAQGLASDKQAEWLVDCYRMRVDDDYAIGGGNLRGLYSASCDPDMPPGKAKVAICEDFLIFCKLAVQHDIVPPGWDWARFLKSAAELLPYAFEKSDAKEKWGGENIFSVVHGGRSLRYTGEQVYGVSAMSMGMDEKEGRDYDRLTEEVEGKWRQLVRSGDAFADVGGVALWKQLHGALQLHPAVF